MATKKKPKKKKRIKAEWLPMVNKDFGDWFGQWMIANVMITSYEKKGKFPSHIKFDKMKELPSGEADLIFEVRYADES